MAVLWKMDPFIFSHPTIDQNCTGRETEKKNGFPFKMKEKKRKKKEIEIDKSFVGWPKWKRRLDISLAFFQDW